MCFVRSLPTKKEKKHVFQIDDFGRDTRKLTAGEEAAQKQHATEAKKQSKEEKYVLLFRYQLFFWSLTLFLLRFLPER